VLSRQHWTRFSGSHKSFDQGAWCDLEWEMVQIGSLPAGERADLLQLVEAGLTQAKVIQADRQTQLAQQGQQLAMCLRSQAIASETLFKAQLDQDAESHLLSMENGMAGFQLGQAVVNGMGSDCSTARPPKASDDPRGEAAGIHNSPPGFASWLLDGIKAVDQQLVTKNSGHLNCLLNHPVAAGSAAHGGFVPLGQSVGDAARQGSSRCLKKQVMIEDQQIRAALESLITLKGTIRAVQIREGSPTGAGGSAQWNRDTGNVKSVGQQFAAVENFASPRGDHTITGLADEVFLKPLKIEFAAIVLEVLLINRQPADIQATAKLRTERISGLTPSKQQRRVTEFRDGCLCFHPGS
jgi:hypothetical protein